MSRMTKLEAKLQQAERCAFEAMKWQAAHEASLSDDRSYVASLKRKADDYLEQAAKALNSIVRGSDPFEIDTPYAVLSLAAGIREGVI